MARYNQCQIQASRDRLLGSAFKNFRLKGYHGAGLDEITKEAGLTKGAFYSHYDSKRDLFDAVVLKTIEYRKEVFKKLAGLGDNDKAIAFVNWYLSLEHLQNVATGCLIPKLSGDLADHLANNYVSGTHYIQEVVCFFESCGISRGSAIYFTSTLTGALTLARAMSTEQGVEFIEATKSLLTTEILKVLQPKFKEYI